MSARLEKTPPARQRQRALLYFLEWSNKRGLTRTELQKLLLLYTEENASRHYAFVPYQYGGYSFQCERDLGQLEQTGWIEVRHKRWTLKHPIGHEYWVEADSERSTIKEWIADWRLRGNALIAESYRRYPYYAINSTIKNKLSLNKSELAAIDTATPRVSGRNVVVFTLGYEGLHFETWANRLIENSIMAVCDVRRNPWSRKYGFSRSQLQKNLPKINIEYAWFPKLGIASSERIGLNSKAEYRALFKKYRHELSRHTAELEQLRQVIKARRRIALTCFEAHHRDCHRHCLSEKLTRDHNYMVRHL